MGIFAQIDSFLPHILGLAGLLFLSAFFSGSETALCALNRARVRRLRDLAGRRGRAVAELLSSPAQLFMTVLVGNTLVNVALASIVASLAIELFDSRGLYFAIGISTDEVNRFQGFHSPHLLVLFDEALGVDPKIWEAAEGLHPHRFLAIGNPLNPEGTFFNCFSSELWNKITI